MSYGDKIAGSVLYRVYCNRCGEPIRTTEDNLYCDENKKIPTSHFCELCSPVHQGVGNGENQFDDGDYDIDAFAPSWKCGN